MDDAQLAELGAAVTACVFPALLLTVPAEMTLAAHRPR